MSIADYLMGIRIRPLNSSIAYLIFKTRHFSDDIPDDISDIFPMIFRWYSCGSPFYSFAGVQHHISSPQNAIRKMGMVIKIILIFLNLQNLSSCDMLLKNITCHKKTPLLKSGKALDAFLCERHKRGTAANNPPLKRGKVGNTFSWGRLKKG